MRDPNYIELTETPGDASIEGTPEDVARRWLGMDQRPDIELTLHPRIVEAFASTPPVADAFIACGQRGDLTANDRAQINQFAAFLKAVGRMNREKKHDPAQR